MSNVAGWSRTGGDVAAEIEMVQTNWTGPILVVEGPSDELFLARRLSPSVYFVQADGRINVECAINIIDNDERQANRLVLGIKDEDYDWFTSYMHPSNNLVKVDPRDLESMLVRSSGLDAVLVELADRGLVRLFEESTGTSVREAILIRAEFFGRIRMFNAISRRVCLRAFKPRRFCNVENWSYDEDAALDEAVRLGVWDDKDDLRAAVSGYTFPTIWHCVRGHDLIEILKAGLLGVLARKSYSTNEIERLMRQAMSREEFLSTALFAGIREWQTRRGCVVVCVD